MDALSMAFIGQGVAAGAEDAPFRTQRLSMAKSQARAAEQQVEEFDKSADLRETQREAEMSALKAQVYQTNAALAKQQTFDAFQRYMADGDPKHINAWVQDSKSNPVLSNLTSDMVRVDRLARTPETEKMLQAAGVRDIDGFFSDPSNSSQFLVGTSPTGQQELLDFSTMAAVTGFNRQMTDQQLEDLTKRGAVIQQFRAGMNFRNIKENSEIVTRIANSTGMDRGELYQMLKADPVAGLDYTPKTARGAGGAGAAGSGRTLVERVAAQIRSQDPNVDYITSLQQAQQMISGGKGTNEDKFVSDYQIQNPTATREEAVAAYRQAGKDERTSAIKNAEYAEEAAVELDKAFEGDFLRADLNNMTPDQTRTVNKYINRIEQVGGLELSNEDKKNARQIKRLLGTTYTASKISEDQVGPIDSTLTELKSYISNNVEGKEGSQAYENVRALARNALFGAQVSAADYKAADKIMRGTSHQAGPILASLKGQLQMWKDDINATASLNDPYVAKARFGVSLEELDKIEGAIQDRIDLLNRGSYSSDGATNSGIKVNVKPKIGNQPGTGQVPDTRQPLTDIFGGAK